MAIRFFWLVAVVVLLVVIVGAVVIVIAIAASAAAGRARPAQSPVISPDGRSWWDGREWKPLPQPGGGPTTPEPPTPPASGS